MTSLPLRWFFLLIFAFAVASAGVPAIASESASKPAAALNGAPTEKSVRANGATINYKIAGRGPVVVLLHGYTQTSHMWLPLISTLSATHTVIAPDLRGAGRSERTREGYDKKTLAIDIRELVRVLGHEQVTVVGLTSD